MVKAERAICRCAIIWFIASGAARAAADDMATWEGCVRSWIACDEYRLSANGPTAYGAPNRGQNFRIMFSPAGATVRPRTGDAVWEWRIGLSGMNGDSVGPGEVCVEGERIEIAREGVVEWFENRPEGLKHGFTIFELRNKPRLNDTPTPASRQRHEALRIELDVGGSLEPVVGRDAVEFRTMSGAAVIRYDGLHVTDANGRVLASWFKDGGRGRVSVVVDIAGATYPITVDPLATNANWTVECNQPAAQMGFSVSSAGDVNGDMISDVIVGAPFFDNGQTDEGRAYVFLGSPTGLLSTPVWTGEGNLAECRFGTSVAAAGDVNGDGYGDIIVGAEAFTNTATHEGRAFVYHGGPSGPSAAANWFAESGQDGALFAASVACAGDANADGFADVMIGCPYCDFGEVNNGRAFIWYGGPTGLGANGTQANADAGISITQSAALFGGSVAGAGDVNGDGVSDVIVGARLFDNGQIDEGAAFVYHGPLAGNITTAAWVGESNQSGAYMGQSVATAGDVNGDGYADVIVGAPYFDNGQVDEGMAFVFLGSASGLGASAVWTSEGDSAGVLHAASVSTAGDVNGDGFADVIVGAYFFTNQANQEGRATVYVGGSSGPSVSATHTLEGNSDGALFGFSVATAGDVNGDGMSDVIVGSRYFSNGESQEGRASAFYGAASGPALSPGWMFEGNQDGADLGISVASAGDVNGDGYCDVIVGAEGFDNGQANEGRAFLFYGGANGLGTTPAWTVESNQAGAEFGVNVGTAGDVNGDGHADVLVCSWMWSNPESHEGGVFLYYGGPSGPSLTPDWQYESNQAESWMGRQAETAGDVNGDGYSDVIVGNSLYDNGEVDEGRVLVFHGSAMGLSLTPNWSAESNQATVYFGRAVGTAGDVNGDGYSDVIVGGYLWDNGETDEGGAWIWFGGPSGLGANGTPGNADWSAESNNAGAVFGIRVGTAGDVNGDGYSDVIIGARTYSNGEAAEGRAYVYLGGPLGPGAVAAWITESNQASANFGNAAGTAGDVNGDGYSDVIVGAWLMDNGQADEGQARLYLGSATGLSTTPDWVAESNQVQANFGWAVATAGDVNGDGYAEVIIGAYQYDNGSTNEGSAFLYYGNGGRGLSLRPEQRRADNAAPIGRLNNSDREDRFRLAALGRTPMGRSRVRMQWEVKPFGVTLNGTGLQQSALVDTGVVGANLSELATGLAQGNQYHWRMRLVYDAARDPWYRASRWFTPANSGWQEADVRIGVPPPQVIIHPSPVVTCAGGPTIQFSVSAIGAAPLSYSWRKGMMPLSNGGRISGATTATLQIASPIELTDMASYDCVVTNSVGVATSNAAMLTVWASGTGDTNIDGQVNVDDVPSFVMALMSGVPSQGNCAADLNGDGKLNGLDVAPFADLLVP